LLTKPGGGPFAFPEGGALQVLEVSAHSSRCVGKGIGLGMDKLCNYRSEDQSNVSNYNLISPPNTVSREELYLLL